jgi:hypothetical protein
LSKYSPRRPAAAAEVGRHRRDGHGILHHDRLSDLRRRDLPGADQDGLLAAGEARRGPSMTSSTPVWSRARDALSTSK